MTKPSDRGKSPSFATPAQRNTSGMSAAVMTRWRSALGTGLSMARRETAHRHLVSRQSAMSPCQSRRDSSRKPLCEPTLDQPRIVVRSTAAPLVLDLADDDAVGRVDQQDAVVGAHIFQLVHVRDFALERVGQLLHLDI